MNGGHLLILKQISFPIAIENPHARTATDVKGPYDHEAKRPGCDGFHRLPT